jgi:hypothetical protein
MRVSFTFIVYLIIDNKRQDVTPYQNEIIKWYQNIANEYNFSDMRLKYIGYNMFTGNYSSFNHSESNCKLDLEIFVDPDEDGSHPYKPNTYVIGKLIKIIENSII